MNSAPYLVFYTWFVDFKKKSYKYVANLPIVLKDRTPPSQVSKPPDIIDDKFSHCFSKQYLYDGNVLYITYFTMLPMY